MAQIYLIILYCVLIIFNSLLNCMITTTFSEGTEWASPTDKHYESFLVKTAHHFPLEKKDLLLYKIGILVLLLVPTVDFLDVETSV